MILASQVACLKVSYAASLKSLKSLLGSQTVLVQQLHGGLAARLHAKGYALDDFLQLGD